MWENSLLTRFVCFCLSLSLSHYSSRRRRHSLTHSQPPENAPQEQPNDPAGLPSAVGFQNFTLTNGGNTFDFPCFCNNNNWQEDCYLGHYSNSAYWGFLKDNNLKSGKLYCDYISNMGRTLGGYPRGVFESDHLASLFEDWLEALPTDAAFLAHVSFRTNHSPYVASLPVRAACSSGDICNNAVTTQDLDWGGNLNQMDQAIGRIKDSLDRIRPEDDTLIFILSDNGPEKHTLDGDGNTNGLVGCVFFFFCFLFSSSSSSHNKERRRSSRDVKIRSSDPLLICLRLTDFDGTE